MRLSGEGRRLLRQLAGWWGVTQTAVMELALREMAERSGVRKPDGGLGEDAGHGAE